MTSSKRLLSQTAETAAFAFREFFRPVVVVVRFLTSCLASSELAGAVHNDRPARKGVPKKDKTSL
jgi:hypothetical protein